MFNDLPLAMNLVVFGVGAALIWWAGIRLERLTDAIAELTGVGSAFAGLVFLAAATSLPEVATTVTALLRGDVELATHNLLGGVAFQVVVLAIADAAGRRGALTAFAPSFGLLIQGVGLVLVLAVGIGGLVLAERLQVVMPLGPVSVGVYPAVLLLPVLYLAVAWATYRARGNARWRPVAPRSSDHARDPHDTVERSGRGLGLAFAGFAIAILVGGWLSATVADVMATQTGLSSGFVGATLLALASSLPEVSTTFAAVRHGNEELAVSNVMGSNAFDVALLAVVSVMAADAFGRGPLGGTVYLAALGIALTCVYLWGLLAHAQRSVAGVGLDSIAVVALYLTGMATLYGLG